jgi:S-ribosylhomocysteine lyase
LVGALEHANELRQEQHMVNVEELGWDASTAIELDHSLLKAPHVKLRSCTTGEKGDVVFCIDLRINRPNIEISSTTELHSMEHFLLEGFRKYLPENFISIGVMGCQTGFYLVLLNEGHAQKVCSVYKSILNDILAAKKVPYASLQECGNYRNHDLAMAQKVARRLLETQSNWLQVI